MATAGKPAAPTTKPNRVQQLFELQQTMAQTQQTMAQTQRTFAEALRALSSGIATGVDQSALEAGGDSVFVHSGCLELDSNGQLFLNEGNFLPNGEPDRTATLESIAMRGPKRIRLEFTLEKTEIARINAVGPLFTKLENFLQRRSKGRVPMEAQCPIQQG